MKLNVMNDYVYEHLIGVLKDNNLQGFFEITYDTHDPHKCIKESLT